MRIRSPLLTKLAAWVGITLTRLLLRTCRIKVYAEADGRIGFQPNPEKFYVYCMWHDTVLISIFCGQMRPVSALVSRHQDGSFLAEGLKILGIDPVRGSSSRGGGKALRELMTAMKRSHLAITPDGPRGPHHEMKNGAVYIASQTKSEIVSLGCACPRSWRFKGSWTDMVIPKPFSKIYFFATNPVRVPSGLTREGVEQYRLQIQGELDRATEQAERLSRGESVSDNVTPIRIAA